MLTLYKRRILLKIIFGYLLAVSLMVGIVFFSLNRLNEIKETVDDLTNRLAVTRTLSQSITGKIRLVRFYAERYQRFYNQEDLDLFNEKIIDLQKGLEEISSQVSNPERLKKIRYIQQETSQYEKEFENIARLIMYQQSLLSTTFLKQELLIENQLSAIRINVGIVQNPDIFFSFGNARNSFQLMRLYQSKYLSEENEKYYVMFKSNYKYASQAFSALNTALEDATDNSRISKNAAKANAELKIYYETFLKIRTASLNLKKASRELDHHELEVTDTASKIASDIEEEYQVQNTVMESLVLRTQIELVVAVILAISLSLGLIYIVSRKITTPIFNKMQMEAEELKRARDKAEIANRVKTDFVANMSHELRTPLNAVIGFSELLSSMDLDTRQKSFVDAIETAGKNLLMLIDDILDLSKIEAGKIELQPSAVSLTNIVTDIKQIFALTISEKLLEFSINHMADLPELLYLDEVRVRQVLLNLIGNAIKFSEEGQVRVQSDVLARHNSTIDLRISVIDTGIGIAEEDQEKVFQSFEQQSNQNAIKYGGTGLGLSITRQLVELMGGKITLTSSPGKGSRFDVDLFNVQVASEEERGALPRSDHQDISFVPAKVLVADDIISNRVLLQEFLSERQLEVITASNGREAVEMACEQMPALIMLDLRMPLLSGVDAANQLKMNVHTKHIPIIALTASSTVQENSLVLDQGFDGFLAKPIKFETLIKELSRFLEPVIKPGEMRKSPPLPSEIPTVTIRQPLELLHTLRREIRPLLQSLEKAFVVSDYKRLGERLEQIAHEYRVQHFSLYASHIEDLVESFDSKGMNDSMKIISASLEAFMMKLETTDE
ncbi:ATP-binding protein [Desulfopila sp. IMCC35008]|uniref:ATP-binding protein n=1 Tax=Desulfopila sp. IMCC35008 TaxID=2653858 RepID=UPI0013D84CD0|nr:ATP-binding protein [Desulfopila sp. IMCC35008]